MKSASLYDVTETEEILLQQAAMWAERDEELADVAAATILSTDVSDDYDYDWWDDADDSC